jgi:hypothetical protein
MPAIDLSTNRVIGAAWEDHDDLLITIHENTEESVPSIEELLIAPRNTLITESSENDGSQEMTLDLLLSSETQDNNAEDPLGNSIDSETNPALTSSMLTTESGSMSENDITDNMDYIEDGQLDDFSNSLVDSDDSSLT